MKIIFNKHLLSIVLLVCSFTFHGQFYSGYSQEFGKNRVQYRTFDWTYYPTDRYEVYYYKGGKDLAAYILQAAEKNIKPLEKFFDYSIDGKIQIITYNKQSEFRQSNIGITDDENLGGVTQIVGSKLFIYYESDHQQLNDQINKSLSRIMFQQMMFGTQWKDVMKNNSMMSIPKWFEEGLIAYATHQWNPTSESFVKSGIESGVFDNFNLLTDKQSEYAGLAMWKYIADVYGDNVIPNILYMTRASRNIESGFNFVLGVSLSSLMADMNLYYSNYFFQNGEGGFPDIDPVFTPGQEAKFAGEKGAEKKNKFTSKILGELPVVSKEKYRYSQVKMSPDQQYIAFATHELGQFKVWLYDLNSGKKKRILKKEPKLHRIEDNTFPVLAWHPTGQVLSFAYEYRGRPFMGSYYMEDKEFIEKELFRIDKVIDMHYSDDGRKMVFSGVAKGQTDLYLYQIIGNSQTQLTNDIYDDMNPRFIRNSTAVIFASNRPDDTLRAKVPIDLFELNKDIFVLELEGDKELKQITSTPKIDETNPFEYYGGRNYTFLGNENGVKNRYAAFIDSTISRIDTAIHYRYFTVTEKLSAFDQTPLEYEYHTRSGEYSLLFFKNNKFQWFTDNKRNDQTLIGDATSFKNYSNSNILILIDEDEDKGEVDTDDYVFDRENPIKNSNSEVVIFSDKDTEEDEAEEERIAQDTVAFELPKPRNYQLNFAIDKISSQANNSFKSEFYQNFTGPTSIYPGLGAMLEVQISDLFEDYKLIGGYRLSSNFRNNNYAFGYKKLNERMDKKITFQRRSERLLAQQSLIKIVTNSMNYELSYPFTELAALKFTGIARNDRLVFLSTDRTNLTEPSFNFSTIGAKVSFVYDNTISKGLNLLNGTRLKVWMEYYQDLKYPTTDENETIEHSSLFVFEKETDLKVIGLDIRHYQPLHRNIIGAVRLAGSSSFGSYKLINYLGGMDNWIGQRVDQATVISQNQPYVYQAMSTPVRGFFLNARNGSNFGVINSEIRWPIFKYFIKKPIRSDFLANFQLTSFLDVGSAWNGWSPYSKENEFNTQVIEGNPITVTIDNNREPIIYGYGYGLRSRLLGYFMKLDVAWGVDDGVQLDRVLHFSLGKDF